MNKKIATALSVAATAVFLAGCVTDYVGWAEHQTQSEAKLWGQEVAVSTGIDQETGTYAPTVKYDCRGQGSACSVFLVTYRNPVFGAFSRDGIVDRDGEDIQGNAGSLTAAPATPAGQFHKAYTWSDNAAGCQFFSNLKQNFLRIAPAIAFCFTAPSEEIDKDLDLHEDFGDLGQLFAGIWSGVVGRGFSIEMTSIELNGISYELGSPLSIDMAHNGLRPMSFAMDLTTPGGKALIQAILENTNHGEPVTLAANFSGGMRVALPVIMAVAFNHDRLEVIK
ncbi:MAG: hypothetical protein GTN62_00095 [Gemmatimonadales bacterium]|nr:hypothetical protein [Gemmatimonadales bacterium]NIP05972.1 hypothetical protein [Gemmatimonadales bacterium]NIS64383.1 hypothetical protein [Gemmatimonadales bacterium]